MIGNNLAEFNGKTVVDFNPEEGILDPESMCYRLRIDWDMPDDGVTVQSLLEAFLIDARSVEVTELVIGAWTLESEDNLNEVTETLIAGKSRLPRLEALFIGDITVEEQEISWINQTDVGDVVMAFPKLHTFCVRGGNGLGLSLGRHNALKKLVIQTGGLPGTVLHDIDGAELPNLEHLELWLGDENYGADATLDEVAVLATKFPKLTFLGLMNCEWTDDIAKALGTWKLPPTLEVLDLSMGTLGDPGAKALLALPQLAKLKALNLRHHYLSDGMLAKIKAAFPRANVNDRVENSDYDPDDEDPDIDARYVEVAE